MTVDIVSQQAGVSPVVRSCSVNHGNSVSAVALAGSKLHFDIPLSFDIDTGDNVSLSGTEVWMSDMVVTARTHLKDCRK